MNVTHIGAPSSGKTTNAALVFSELKHQGVIAEFVPEAARMYIARKRRYDWHADKSLCLTDLDQELIMQQQFQDQMIMGKAVGKYGVMISDASPLSCLGYMTAPTLDEERIRQWAEATVKITDLLLFAHFIDGEYDTSDSNRIHSAKEARAVHDLIPALLARFAPGVPVIELRGDSLARKGTTLRAIYDRLPT